mgnify:CR=1 FL=1
MEGTPFCNGEQFPSPPTKISEERTPITLSAFAKEASSLSVRGFWKSEAKLRHQKSHERT